ncbi:MAG TPA: glycosyl hydrolase family 18 protein [Paenibacillus sp.]|jgi:chitinase
MIVKVKLFRKSTILVLIAALILSMFQFFGAEKVQAAEGYKVVGYYPSWGAYGRNYLVGDIDASKVTHINFAFADICWNGKHGNPDPTGPNPVTWTCQDEVGTINVPNGTIVVGDPWVDVQKSMAGDTWDKPIKGSFGQLINLKKANPHLKTIISVGGWSWSNRFSDVAATAATREVFANSAVNFLRKYQFDGIDLDWEYPVGGGLAGNSYRPADKQNHTLLLQAVRDKLNAAEIVDGKKYLLTIASGASPTYVANNEMSSIVNILDWINIMTYDFNGGWQTVSAHNSPLYSDPTAVAAGVPNAADFNVQAGVQGYLNAGVPANKIVLGTPFYGRGWSSCQNSGNGQYQNCSAATTGTWEKGVYDFTDLQNSYINKNGYTRYWNDIAKVPYLYNPSNGNFISYDDVESFGHKTNFIKSNGLGGAMFWDFSGDRNKVLLNKLASDLQGTTVIDNQAPTVPGNLSSPSKTSNSVNLTWNASTDNVGVTGYTVSYGTNSVNVAGTSTTISGLSANTAYTFTVKARDAAGNNSEASVPLQVTTEAVVVDTTPPTVPGNLQTTGTSSSSVSLSWNASTDNVGVVGYTVTYGTTNVNVTGTSTTISGLSANTAYTFTVKAKDAAGNVSAASTPVQASTTAAPVDTIAPTQPTNLQVTGKSVSSVNLSWDASTDNVGVTGYTVTYGTTSVNMAETTAVVSGLSASTTYTFTVTARDAAGNISTGATIDVTTDATGGPTAWATNVSYKVNDIVTYGGKTYICIQPHTSIGGWEPSNVPALWRVQ